MKTESLEPFKRQNLPVAFLRSPSVNKDQLARQLAAERGIASGLVCAISALEPSPTFEHRGTHIIRRERPCHVLYHFQIHPRLGWMHARIQTWFPFNIQVALNGREWLARQMDEAGLRYRQEGNCFVWIEDYEEAGKLLQQQLETNWPELLNGFAQQLNPIHESLFERYPSSYYWTCYQSEWTTDVVFREGAFLKTADAAVGAPRHAELLKHRRAALLRPEGEPIGRDSGLLQRDAANGSETPPGRGARQIQSEWELREKEARRGPRPSVGYNRPKCARARAVQGSFTRTRAAPNGPPAAESLA